jgi:adenylate cyclase
VLYLKGRYFWGKRTKDSFPKAKTATEKAIALDDSLAEAHVSLAMVRAAYDWDWTRLGAGVQARHPVKSQLCNCAPVVRDDIGVSRPLLEAENEVKRGPGTRSFIPIANMAVAEVCAWEGKHGEAIAQYKRTLELDPRFYSAYGNLAVSLAQNRMFEEASNVTETKAVLQGEREHDGRIHRAYAQSGYRGIVEAYLKGCA